MSQEKRRAVQDRSSSSRNRGPVKNRCGLRLRLTAVGRPIGYRPLYEPLIFVQVVASTGTPHEAIQGLQLWASLAGLNEA